MYIHSKHVKVSLRICLKVQIAFCANTVEKLVIKTSEHLETHGPATKPVEDISFINPKLMNSDSQYLFASLHRNIPNCIKDDYHLKIGIWKLNLVLNFKKKNFTQNILQKQAATLLKNRDNWIKPRSNGFISWT